MSDFENPVDVAVIGMGVHGAATVHELAQRGLTVIGIDAQTPPAERGSSNGRTRIIREAYFEHSLYVPLVQRAYELWSGMEELTGTVLYRQTGGVSAGPETGELVSGALRSAHEHALEHELLDAVQLRRRFPALLPRPDHVGVFEQRAGVLLVEPCIRTMLQLARGYGAMLHPTTRVERWYAEAAGVVIETTQGTVHARQMVIAAGAWLNPVLQMDTSYASGEARASGAAHASGAARGSKRLHASPLQLPLTVERQTPHWFAPAAGRTEFSAAVCPVTILEYATDRYIYTLPDTGAGVKVGIHHEGTLVDPDTVDLTVSLAEEARVRELLESWMPGAAERVLDATVCLYTNTPDRHFVIDVHPAHDNVLLVSACSGHGFKFAPAIGELVADLLLDRGSWMDLTPFSVARLS
jgi:sarcosine oxidase